MMGRPFDGQRWQPLITSQTNGAATVRIMTLSVTALSISTSNIEILRSIVLSIHHKALWQ